MAGSILLIDRTRAQVLLFKGKYGLRLEIQGHHPQTAIESVRLSEVDSHIFNATLPDTRYST